MPRTISLLLLTYLMMVAIPSRSHAEFLTPLQTRYVPLTDTNWANATSFDQTTQTQKPFDKFDPALGSLSRVIINIFWRVDSTINMTFTTPSTITVTSSGSMAVNRPDGSAMFIKWPLFNHDVSFPDTTPEKKSFTQTFFGNSGPLVLTSPKDLALFTGPGTFNLPVGANAISNFFANTGNGFGEAHTQVAVVLTVQFAFVPELSSLTSLSLGGISLLLFRPIRRRSMAA